MSLVTGKRLTRGQWTVLPMPQWVIDRVDEMGAAEGRPSIKNINNIFYDLDIRHETYPENL